MNKTIKYENLLTDQLTDPEIASEYLNEALAEGPQVFTKALRDVVLVLGGGVLSVSQEAALNRESLYRMLSEKGNPKLASLAAVMKVLGLSIHIQPNSKHQV